MNKLNGKLYIIRYRYTNHIYVKNPFIDVNDRTTSVVVAGYVRDFDVNLLQQQSEQSFWSPLSFASTKLRVPSRF